MRILFAGTPEIALPSLRLLHNEGYVEAVLTSPDAPRGRSRLPVPSPVREEAEGLGLNVLTPEKIDTSFREKIAGYNPDLLIVVAYGKIFGPRFLSLFTEGGINLHPSLLPLHRGPAPIPFTILNGDTHWGLTVQRVAREMDAGDILIQKTYPCNGSETSGSLLESAAVTGAAAILEAVRQIEQHTVRPVAQEHSRATYSSMIAKNDGRINWQDPADKIERMSRAYDPWPGAFTTFNDKKLTLWKCRPVESEIKSGTPGQVISVDSSRGILIQTGKGVLSVLELQLQGKKRLTFKEFINGVRNLEGAILGGTNV